MHPSQVSLISIHARPDRATLLYELLKERDDTINVSHATLPEWDKHVAFVDSNPYLHWYFIQGSNDLIVGSCYLTQQNELGVFIFKAHQGKGYGRRALELIMQRFGKRRYLANINPRNERSISLFSRLGFHVLQHTYAKN